MKAKAVLSVVLLLLAVSNTTKAAEWLAMGDIPRGAYLVPSDDRLFAVGLEGSVYESREGQFVGVSWVRDLRSAFGGNGRLYAQDIRGEISVMDEWGDWKELGFFNDLIMATAGGGAVYAVLRDGTQYRRTVAESKFKFIGWGPREVRDVFANPQGLFTVTFGGQILLNRGEGARTLATVRDPRFLWSHQGSFYVMDLFAGVYGWNGTHWLDYGTLRREATYFTVGGVLHAVDWVGKVWAWQSKDTFIEVDQWPKFEAVPRSETAVYRVSDDWVYRLLDGSGHRLGPLIR